MHQVTDEEFALLNAAKQMRNTWGQVDGKVITRKGRQGRDAAESVLLDVIRLAHACPDTASD